MRFHPLFSPLAAAVLAIAPTLRADVTFTIAAPSADTFVVSGNNTANNFGGAGVLQITAPGNPKGEFQSVLRFDLPAARAAFDAALGVGGWSISSATLSLGTNVGTPGVQPNNPMFASINAGSFEVRWFANDTWIEGTGSPSSPSASGLNFNTLPNFTTNTVSLGTFSFTAPGDNTVSTYALALPAIFTTDLASDAAASLQLLAGDSGISYLFNSRTFGTATQRPKLILAAAAVPEPAVWSTAAGLCALALAALRRRR